MNSYTSRDIFRLLVPVTEQTPAEAGRILLNGSYWTPTAFTTVKEGKSTPYIAVSYFWGSGRVPNPLVPSRPMSARVIPVLESAIRALNPSAIWVDAFCVPDLEPRCTICLRSMGAIYNAAVCVAGVLSPDCSPLIAADAGKSPFDEAELVLLETDPWPSRSWTYQELVNSRKFVIVAEGGSLSASGMDFLRDLSCGVQDYQKARGYDSFQVRALFPRLELLEDAMTDWQTADYIKRSAYQAMSSMDRRTAEVPDDYYYALIGAFSSDPLGSMEDASIPPAEHFMRLCEEKKDFSFIYSSAPRNPRPGKRWRPLAGRIPAIQPWHTIGPGQTGEMLDSHLRLHNMLRLNWGCIQPPAKAFVDKWLARKNSPGTEGNSVDRILALIRQAGFTGCGRCLEMEEGYFFPQSPGPDPEGLVPYASVGLHWTHGGPGVTVVPGNPGPHAYHDAGVFIGPLPKEGKPLDLS